MNHVAKSSLIVAFFFGIDKVLGFVRQLLVARQFSLSYELDVFNAANNIPDLLSALISGGALGIALIPVLSEYLEKKRQKRCLGALFPDFKPCIRGNRSVCHNNCHFCSNPG